MTQRTGFDPTAIDPSTAAIDTAAIDTAAIDTAAIDTAPIVTAAIDRATAGRPARRALSRNARQNGSAAATVYRQLRSDIISMRRRPGEPVAEKQITEAFGVSRTPVREALLRLADEGLVEIFPQSGTFIAPIPVAALPEASVIRKALETAAVRYAALRATPPQIDALRANLKTQDRHVRDNDQEAFHQADEAFHALIATVAGYPGFWTVIQQVKVQIDRFRRLTLPIPGRMATVITEHAAVVDAIADHDPEQAQNAMERHLDAIRFTLETIRAANPSVFSGALDPSQNNPW